MYGTFNRVYRVYECRVITAGRNRVNTSKCTTNYVTSFELHDGFIGRKILKLWRQESLPFGLGRSANITRIRSWTFRLPWIQLFTGVGPIMAPRIPWMKLVHFLFRVLKYSLSNYGSASLHLTKLEVWVRHHRITTTSLVVTYNGLVGKSKKNSLVQLCLSKKLTKVMKFLETNLKKKSIWSWRSKIYTRIAVIQMSNLVLDTFAHKRAHFRWLSHVAAVKRNKQQDLIDISIMAHSQIP